MKPLRFAIFGTGFWANYQIPGWLELPGVNCVAAYNRTLSKGQKIGKKFNIESVYDDPEELFEREDLDFVDICTNVETHLLLSEMAAKRGIDIVCQKPMASNLEEARELLYLCQKSNVKFFVNENFRWQAPIRALKSVLDSGEIGSSFKARVSFCSCFPVFDNQPFLAELDHFILTDIGSHVLDICRFLFGEAQSLYCQTKRINPKIKGEDVANVMMNMDSDVTCYAEMSYASRLEKESFPQVLIQVEATKGSAVLDHDYKLMVTTEKGTDKRKITPKMYPWVDPNYAVVHSSIVDCQQNILEGLQGKKAETTGSDNIKTVELVWSCYDSASMNKVIHL